MKLEAVFLRGTRAAQPAASAVAIAAHYYVTDENVYERSTGAAWENVEGVAGGAGSDTTAIHDDTSGEIAAVTEKVSPIGADLLLIEDSAATNAKKRVQITNLPAPTIAHSATTGQTANDHHAQTHGSADHNAASDAEAIHDNVAAEISAVTEKVTPVSADLLLIEDSAAANAKKRVQIGNLPGGGAVWTPFGHTSLITSPPTAGWSWDNQSTATATEPTSVSSNQLSISGAVTGLHARYRTAPSTPYTITALLHFNGRYTVNFLRFGLLFRQSADGKIVVHGKRAEASTRIIAAAKYTDSTIFSADYTTVTEGHSDTTIWLRIADDGANRISSYSWDGLNFHQLHSVGRTDFLTADQVGWWIQTEGGAALDVNLISWVEA